MSNMPIDDPSLYHQFKNVYFVVDKNGILRFFGRRLGDDRTVPVSLKDAVKSAIPTEDGLLFQPGYLLPYEEIEAPRLPLVLSNRKIPVAVNKWLIVFKSSIWIREKLILPPRRQPTPVERVGITVTWDNDFDNVVRIDDFAMPQGKSFDFNHIYDLMRRAFGAILENNSDMVIKTYRKGRLITEVTSPEYYLGEEPEAVIQILNAFYFRDTIAALLPMNPEKKKK